MFKTSICAHAKIVPLTDKRGERIEQLPKKFEVIVDLLTCEDDISLYCGRVFQPYWISSRPQKFELSSVQYCRCMDTRKRLGNHDKEVKSQFDRNQKLTGILRQNTR